MHHPLPIAALLLAGACSDYDVHKIGDDPVPPGETGSTTSPPTDGPAPDILVEPGSLLHEGVCEPIEDYIVISNTGDAPLRLDALRLEGEGWTAPLADAPAELAPLDYWQLPFTASAGLATLAIESNDPDQPLVEVPLEARGDETPPTVQITDPAPGAILPIDALVTLHGLVDDNLSPAESLSIEWRSDVAGAIGSDPAAADGSIRQDWAGTRPEGDQTIHLIATDACGNTGTDEVQVCQQAGYDVESLDIKTWNFEGSARWDGHSGWVELTGPTTDQAGTAFQTTSTVDSDDIEIEFAFYVSGGSGADGISLTALDSTRMSGFVGDSGGGIGYAGMPGWSVEVDTWYNPELSDPTSLDHVSVHLDGDSHTLHAWSELPEMEDGSWHTMAVVVKGSHLVVQIDGSTYIDQDIAGLSAFPAYVGFTAATGASTNYHLIDALKVTELVCEE